MRQVFLWMSLGWWVQAMGAEVPANLVIDGIPPIPAEVRASAGRYLETRSAVFQSWHPEGREMLVTTRFAESMQLHRVEWPGGARRQLTFLPEPVAEGDFDPFNGSYVLFAQDQGGGEFFQLYRLDLAGGQVTLLTDGKARNTHPRWSTSGEWVAYSSTRRNGRDTDIYVMRPALPGTDRLLVQVAGGGWTAMDWSPDDTQLLLLQYVSVNESYLHLVDVTTGERKRLTPEGGEKIAHGRARFSGAGRKVLVTSDEGSEFLQLAELDLKTGKRRRLTAHLPWNVEEFELSPDGRVVALVTNEDGQSVLRFMDLRSGKERKRPRLPAGVIAGLKWHPYGEEVGFTLSSARSPSDAYSVDWRRGQVERWTESELGGVDPEGLVEPELVRVRSFDGLGVGAWVYRPDATRFPGRRPVVIQIHGGPEGQARPGFQGRYNHWLNELGVVLIYPNVRGSTGYGKTFVKLDNGRLREDAVKDIGAVLNWVGQDPGCDAGRVAVAGGSYGGYMVLASLVHLGDRLRAGVDVVGISHFVTFLTNTQDYRRDLRRVEYGDERDPEMRAFLEQISPLTQVQRIRRPLLVVQGRNDPRVPASESDQMVRAIRGNAGTVWYLTANDEGHGFRKKANQDYQFLATVLFLKEHLLSPP